MLHVTYPFTFLNFVDVCRFYHDPSHDYYPTLYPCGMLHFYTNRETLCSHKHSVPWVIDFSRTDPGTTTTGHLLTNKIRLIRIALIVWYNASRRCWSLRIALVFRVKRFIVSGLNWVLLEKDFFDNNYCDVSMSVRGLNVTIQYLSGVRI